MKRLPEIDGFWYLGTVFRQHPHGPLEAYRGACVALAQLLKRGIPTFCPIAHGHGAAIHGGLNPTDNEFWIKANAPMIDAAGGMIALKMPGWRNSEGMKEEVAIFDKADKPVVFLDWNDL